MFIILELAHKVQPFHTCTVECYVLLFIWLIKTLNVYSAGTSCLVALFYPDIPCVQEPSTERRSDNKPLLTYRRGHDPTVYHSDHG